MKIVNIKRFFVFCSVVMVLFVLSAFWIFSSLQPVYGEGQTEFITPWTTVVVQSGDTVWSIAEPIAQNLEKDTRDIVRMIYSENHLDAPLHPGQMLKIPHVITE